ncbi:hypothetical protein EVAR_37938_1 [Eumeta japonica]|uniref:Uncharacterized protein n=1 Tax=Eumeta variegata TaxID=151549 RepID=A0A4C1XGT0_EUMVA|nr:hypothetical protein EVAR_37938_1 [Eumeta japonica]
MAEQIMMRLSSGAHSECDSVYIVGVRDFHGVVKIRRWMNSNFIPRTAPPTTRPSAASIPFIIQPGREGFDSPRRRVAGAPINNCSISSGMSAFIRRTA